MTPEEEKVFADQLIKAFGKLKHLGSIALEVSTCGGTTCKDIVERWSEILSKHIGPELHVLIANPDSDVLDPEVTVHQDGCFFSIAVRSIEQDCDVCTANVGCIRRPLE